MSWWQSTSLRRIARAVAVAAAACVLAAAAQAEDMSSCAAFKWPLDKERTAFSNAAIETVTSGATHGAFGEAAFDFKLSPIDAVKFVLAPGGKSKPGAPPPHGGIVSFDAPAKPGLYQITLSGEGWIDLVQDGAALKSAAHSGAKNCPGLRKSVRFEVAAAPVTLQLSSVPADAVRVAIRPVE